MVASSTMKTTFGLAATPTASCRNGRTMGRRCCCKSAARVSATTQTTNAAGRNGSPTLLNEPADIAVDAGNGDIYIADGYGNHRVVVFDANGKFLRQWGEAGTDKGLFALMGGGHPHCAVFDHDGQLYVCDRGNDRIEVFDKMGSLKRVIVAK